MQETHKLYVLRVWNEVRGRAGKALHYCTGARPFAQPPAAGFSRMCSLLRVCRQSILVEYAQEAARNPIAALAAARRLAVRGNTLRSGAPSESKGFENRLAPQTFLTRGNLSGHEQSWRCWWSSAAGSAKAKPWCEPRDSRKGVWVPPLPGS